MSTRPQEMTRNIGIVAHINAGKTTLSECILFETGRQRWVGDVESGTATMDWMHEEQRRGISITAAVTTVSWREQSINLIDTPGHVDFTAEVERCLRVLDGVVVLLDGVRGVESQTESVWRRAERQEMPGVVFVNKLDRATADFEACVASVEQVLGCRPIVVVRPVHRDGELLGLVDVVSGAVRGDLELDAETLESWRQDLVAVCADFDESIMADFVAGQPVADERVRASLRAATLTRDVVPVFAGSALLDLGVDLLLDGVVDYLPEPAPGVSDGTAALLYKVHFDGDDCLGFLRMVGGALTVGQEVEVASSGDRLTVGALWRMHAIERHDVERAEAGEFVAIPLAEPLRTGETLRAPGTATVLEEMKFSQPVLTMSIEPATSAGRGELESRARQIALEDPTLEVRREPTSGELLVSGMGELHLEVFRSRLDRRLAEPARFGRPTVARFETVAAAATESAELARRIEGVECAARATVSVAPVPGSAGVDVSAAVDRDRLVGAVCDELEVLASVGIVSPVPARDLQIRVEQLEVSGDGDAAVDVAVDAAVVACRRAVVAAGRVTLEPIVEFVVETPSESLGVVLADLRSRAAEILEVTPAIDAATVTGEVWLDALLGYAGPLRSMTQGKGALRFEPRRFAPRP